MNARHAAWILAAALGICASQAFGVTPAAHPHLEEVARPYEKNIQDGGYLPAAMSTAGKLVRAAGFAVGEAGSTGGIKRYTRDVLHLLDPVAYPEGPEIGMGLEPAARGAIDALERAAGAEGATDELRRRVGRVQTCMRNVLEWSAEIEETADSLLASDDPERIRNLAEDIRERTRWILAGHAPGPSGDVGWSDGNAEPGLEQAALYMNLLLRAEELPGVELPM